MKLLESELSTKENFFTPLPIITCLLHYSRKFLSDVEHKKFQYFVSKSFNYYSPLLTILPLFLTRVQHTHLISELFLLYELELHPYHRTCCIQIRAIIHMEIHKVKF